MKPTELVYSSHDRCEYLHREWLVQRALENPVNKTVLYLPVSSGSRGDQEYSWGTFSGYLDRFRGWGLDPRTFFWDDDLRREDAQAFFDVLRSAEVVILGGGRTSTGMERYRAMGGRFFDNPDAFLETLRSRQAEGRLTAGFSAGADQLCRFSCDGGEHDPPLFGLVRDVIVQLHYEPAGDGHVAHLARRHPDCLCFGLPNDSGIAALRGTTARGHEFQLLQFVVDESWDRPEDAHHIKTRMGVKIEHRYADGRRWGFNGGDVLLRVFRGDSWEAWIKRPEAPRFHEYGSQRECGYTDLGHILGDR
jgi:hypothetical protein